MNRLLPALLLALVACGRTERSEAPPPPAAQADPSVGAWAWHPLGGLAVIEGEVRRDTELVLEGRSIRERRFAELGPVRWEFFRPPEGESAVLRTAEGQELARFTFSLAPPPPPPSLPRQVRRPEPPPVRPGPVRPEAHLPTPLPPEPPPARTRAATRVPAARLAPLTPRRAGALSLPATPDPALAKARPLPELLPAPSPLPKPTPRPSAAPEPLPPPTSRPASTWPGMGEALNLTRGPVGTKRMLLSFDGGSSAEVAQEVLDLLKARGVRTTLFLTGAFIQRYPALVRRMAADGHELGNHTMHHPHFAPGMKRDPAWTKARFQRELLDADAALVRLLGRPMDPLWRAPYGEHTAELRRWAEELGYRHVGWSEGADTLDWATPKDRRLYRSGEAIVQRLAQRLNRDGDGLIVLMHLGSGRDEGDRPTDGLGAFMDRAQREGWRFVTAGSLLQDLGRPTWDPHQRMALLAAPTAQGR